MNRILSKMLLACQFLTVGTLNSFGQNLQADTGQLQAVLDKTIANYLSAVGNESRLYNGPEYNFYDPIIKGNAYFTDAGNFMPGTVSYDGFTYKNIPMLYDIYKDYVVVLLPNKSAKISLVSERVQNFDLLGHHFVYVNTDTLTDNQGVNTGIYDQIYKNKTEVLVKRSKNIQNSSNTTGSIDTYFNARKETFVKGKSTYRRVSSEGDLLKVFNDKKKELKQYIRTSQIKFKDNQELAIIKIATYYDQLNL